MAFIQLILIANLSYDYYHVDNTLIYLRILLINIYFHKSVLNMFTYKIPCRDNNV